VKLIAKMAATLSITSGVAFGIAAESVAVTIGTIAALWYVAAVIRAANPENDARDLAELDND
jgi:hypothetical protein